MITKPMLAEKCKNKDDIKYPVLATPKLDGIRCLVINGKALTRKFKPVPNRFIRETIEELFPDGVDGELMGAPGVPFNKVASTIMRQKGDPVDFRYFVFDYVVDGDLLLPYKQRMKNLLRLEIAQPKYMELVIPCMITCREDLDDFEERCLAKGYEGIIIRSPGSPYKCGRSTLKEGYMLKIKRFEDSEAEIIGFEEKLHNDNELQQDELGYAKRSTAKAGKRAAGTLGALIVRDLKSGLTFSVGSGFDDALRKEIWDNQKKYLGQIITYRYQPFGVKELPRFPVFKWFRHQDDMSD
jgi:DNA ligase-1